MNISQDMQTVQPLIPQIQVPVAKNASDKAVAELTITAADQTHLSGAASLASQATSVPDVRQEKVAAVQAAIANGTYNVKSSDVAQSLVDHMLGKKI